eukprot:125331-Rhodomonas_salina.2
MGAAQALTTATVGAAAAAHDVVLATPRCCLHALIHSPPCHALLSPSLYIPSSFINRPEQCLTPTHFHSPLSEQLSSPVLDLPQITVSLPLEREGTVASC